MSHSYPALSIPSGRETAIDRIDKVTRSNIRLIREGMSRDRVEQILGPGKERFSGHGAAMVDWTDLDGYRRSVSFFRDRAVQVEVE